MPQRNAQFCSAQGHNEKCLLFSSHLPTAPHDISAQAALLTVTHPLIPSQEGKPPHYKSFIINKNKHPKLPSREGLGVCDACA